MKETANIAKTWKNHFFFLMIFGDLGVAERLKINKSSEINQKLSQERLGEQKIQDKRG